MYRQGGRGQQQETLTATRIWDARPGWVGRNALTYSAVRGGEGPVTKRGETFKTMIKRSCVKAASPQAAALRGPIGAGNKGKSGRTKQKLASHGTLCGDRGH
ncbi:hypothetical protein MRX96_027358 [Rhipicephalus microplus]